MGARLTSEVATIFFSRAKRLAKTTDKPLDLFNYCQSTVSDAMVLLLLGKVRVLQPHKFEPHCNP